MCDVVCGIVVLIRYNLSESEGVFGFNMDKLEEAVWAMLLEKD